jgi:hypothetical protein
MPAEDVAAMKQRHSVAEMSVQGMTTLKGPSLSAKMLGMIPAMPH